jgi:hypothetical protein
VVCRFFRHWAALFRNDKSPTGQDLKVTATALSVIAETVAAGVEIMSPKLAEWEQDDQKEVKARTKPRVKAGKRQGPAWG